MVNIKFNRNFNLDAVNVVSVLLLCCTCDTIPHIMMLLKIN